MKNCSALQLRKEQGKGGGRERGREDQKIYLFIQKCTEYLLYNKFCAGCYL